jgi:hypothetical protein
LNGVGIGEKLPQTVGVLPPDEPDAVLVLQIRVEDHADIADHGAAVEVAERAHRAGGVHHQGLRVVLHRRRDHDERHVARHGQDQIIAPEQAEIRVAAGDLEFDAGARPARPYVHLESGLAIETAGQRLVVPAVLGLRKPVRLQNYAPQGRPGAFFRQTVLAGTADPRRQRQQQD